MIGQILQTAVNSGRRVVQATMPLERRRDPFLDIRPSTRLFINNNFRAAYSESRPEAIDFFWREAQRSHRKMGGAFMENQRESLQTIHACAFAPASLAFAYIKIGCRGAASWQQVGRLIFAGRGEEAVNFLYQEAFYCWWFVRMAEEACLYGAMIVVARATFGALNGLRRLLPPTP